MTTKEKEDMKKQAAAWVGYKEKHVCDYSFYEGKRLGAGINNYTRFGRLADIVLYGADRRVKDGYAWCAMFVLAVLYEMKAGRQDCSVPAGMMTVDAEARAWVSEIATCGGGDLRWHAGVPAWLAAYRHAGRTSQTPSAGDFVVYLDRNGRAYHIGIVEASTGNGWFTTIEGNTSDTGYEVEPNGGCVARKRRKISNNTIFLEN